MIQSFADIQTEAFYRRGIRPRAGWQNVMKVVARKLDMVHAAEELDDLLSPPGNRLEALKGNRAGQHSIRVNDQWRVCFRWASTGPHDVEIVDYH